MLISPFLVTAPSLNEVTDSSLLLSPFLVNHDKQLSLNEMKMLMNIFKQEDFNPLSPVKQPTNSKKSQYKQYSTSKNTKR